MSEKPIRQNTIVSTTDKRLTLLQWLKQVQGQLKDLKDKGVKAVVEEFDTPEAFYNAYSTKPSGTPVLAIVADDTAIMGTLSEITDKLILKGTIYQGGKVYTSAEADTLRIVGGGELASVDYANQLAESLKLSLEYYGDSNSAMYARWKSETHNVGDFVKIYWRGGTYGYRVIFGQIQSISTGTYPKYYILGFGIEDAWSEYAMFYSPCWIETFVDEIGIDGTSYIKSDDKRIKGIYSQFSHEGGGYTPSIVAGGFKEIGNGNGLGFVGCFQAYDYTTFLPQGSCAQGLIFDRKNKEVYYPVNGYITCTSANNIENAISGTQLKEAVRLATQKTNWHSVKIKGANGIFTFNAPSTLNTPVVSTEKLLELFNNDTWAGFGKLGTDMLFGIRLLNDNIKFMKDDGTKVSLDAFGTIDISDDVKEVR